MQKNYKKTVKELERKNYYLKRENKILRKFVKNYQGWSRVLKGFILIIFILKQLVIRLYLLDFFDNNNTYIIIF